MEYNHTKLVFLCDSVGEEALGGGGCRLLTLQRYLEGSRSCFPQVQPVSPPWEGGTEKKGVGVGSRSRGLKGAFPLIYELTWLQDTSSSGMGFCFRGSQFPSAPPAATLRVSGFSSTTCTLTLTQTNTQSNLIWACWLASGCTCRRQVLELVAAVISNY